MQAAKATKSMMVTDHETPARVCVSELRQPRQRTATQCPHGTMLAHVLPSHTHAQTACSVLRLATKNHKKRSPPHVSRRVKHPQCDTSPVVAAIRPAPVAHPYLAPAPWDTTRGVLVVVPLVVDVCSICTRVPCAAAVVAVAAPIIIR